MMRILSAICAVLLGLLISAASAQQVLRTQTTSFDDISSLEAISFGVFQSGAAVIISEEGRAGTFVKQTGDLSALATNDPEKCVFVPSPQDATGASGGYIRQDFLEKKAIKAIWCGLNIDGTTDDADAINAALVLARAYDLRTELPPGNMAIASGSTIELRQGDHLEGAGLDQTTLTSLGGTAPVVGSRVDFTANFVTIKDFLVKGADIASSVGIRIEGMQYNSVMEHIEVVDFERCVYINDSWTFEIRNSRIGANGETCTYGIWAENWTEGQLYHTRVDVADEDNIYITQDTGGSGQRTTGLTIFHGAIQHAGDANIRLIDVPRIHIYGTDFEGADADDTGSADIEVEDGSNPASTMLTIEGAYFTTTPIDDTTTARSAIRIERGTLIVNGVNVNDSVSAIYESFVNVASANVDFISINGTDNLNPNNNGGDTPFVDCDGQTAPIVSIVGSIGHFFGACQSDMPDRSDGLDGTGTIDAWRYEVIPQSYIVNDYTGNGYFRFNSPANRRLEFQLENGGTGSWYMGRGDSDETNANDFYIGRVSGGGNPPALRIENGVSGSQDVFIGQGGLEVSGALLGLVGVEASSEVTIASGAITITQTSHRIDTESDASSDDLDTINGGDEGDILILRTDLASRDVTLKDSTGNIFCGADQTLSHPRDKVILYRGATNWECLSFFDGAP